MTKTKPRWRLRALEPIGYRAYLQGQRLLAYVAHSYGVGDTARLRLMFDQDYIAVYQRIA